MSTTRGTRPLPPNTLPPNTLLTAVPGLIGFLPERSLIFLAFGDRPDVLRTTMRHDLVLDDDGALVPGLVDVMAGLGEICERNDVESVVAVIADDRYPANDPRYHDVCAVADHEFAAVGGIRAGFVVPEFRTGARWRTIWHTGRDIVRPRGMSDPLAHPLPVSGTLSDPHASPTALEAAMSTGRQILPNRAAIETLLSPLQHCIGPHRDRASTRLPDDTHDGAGEELIELIGRNEVGDGALLRFIVRWVIAGPGVGELDCATVTLMGIGLTRLRVRDAALALAATDFRHEAEALWRELARRLRGSEAASAATMLAHLYYVGGEGAYAGVALDHALAADPDWALAGLLDQALRGGIPPQMLRGMIDGCWSAAAELGVALPPSTDQRRAG